MSNIPDEAVHSILRFTAQPFADTIRSPTGACDHLAYNANLRYVSVGMLMLLQVMAMCVFAASASGCHFRNLQNKAYMCMFVRSIDTC